MIRDRLNMITWTVMRMIASSSEIKDPHLIKVLDLWFLRKVILLYRFRGQYIMICLSGNRPEVIDSLV